MLKLRGEARVIVVQQLESMVGVVLLVVLKKWGLGCDAGHFPSAPSEFRPNTSYQRQRVQFIYFSIL